MILSDVVKRLFPEFDVQTIAEADEGWYIFASSTQGVSPCPTCGQMSEHIHSQYTRYPADVPWGGYVLKLELKVFRFFCKNRMCKQRVFCQRHPHFLATHAQATQRFNESIQKIALEAGGEGGHRLGKALGIQRSADTYLRQLKQVPIPEIESPRVVGIDDWAWRKGHHYGTIICDLERSEVIDILPDREEETVTAWLKCYPSIEIITRDRAKVYRKAANAGAPQAIQIADRWHLLKNLFDGVKRVFEGYQPLLKQISKDISQKEVYRGEPKIHIETQTWHPIDVPDDNETIQAQLQDENLAPAIRRRFLLVLVHRWRKAGLPIKEIMAQTQLSRASIYRYLNYTHLTLKVMHSPDITNLPPSPRQLRNQKIIQLRDEGVTIAEIVHRVGMSRASIYRVLAAAGKSHRGQREYFPGVEKHNWTTRFNELWQDEVHDLQILWENLHSEGYKMSFASVRRAVYRQYTPISIIPRGMVTQQIYRPRKAAWCFVLNALELDKSDYQFLRTCLQTSADLLQLYALAQGFQHLIVQSRRLSLFEHWITQATSCIFPEIQRFARGLLQDEDAVRAALTYSWSNGPVEGQVLRLKLNRRKMYGRGNLELLKRRVICAIK